MILFKCIQEDKNIMSHHEPTGLSILGREKHFLGPFEVHKVHVVPRTTIAFWNDKSIGYIISLMILAVSGLSTLSVMALFISGAKFPFFYLMGLNFGSTYNLSTASSIRISGISSTVWAKIIAVTSIIFSEFPSIRGKSSISSTIFSFSWAYRTRSSRFTWLTGNISLDK